MVEQEQSVEGVVEYIPQLLYHFEQVAEHITQLLHNIAKVVEYIPFQNFFLNFNVY